jgi:hypothetical protein
MDTEPGDEIVERVGVNRRTFVRRLVVGSAFAVPVVSSFSLQSLSENMASAATSH